MSCLRDSIFAEVGFDTDAARRSSVSVLPTFPISGTGAAGRREAMRDGFPISRLAGGENARASGTIRLFSRRVADLRYQPVGRRFPISRHIYSDRESGTCTYDLLHSVCVVVTFASGVVHKHWRIMDYWNTRLLGPYWLLRGADCPLASAKRYAPSSLIYTTLVRC